MIIEQAPRKERSDSRPNIVFVLSDGHSYKYTGYAGHPVVKTPNLDRIARVGTVFTSAYCGHPVCVASRASLMTGMYPSDCNSFCNSTVWDGSYPTWGRRLSQAGYYCRAVGKMDLNDDFDTGFEEIETRHGHRHNPDITSLFRRPLCYRVNERPGLDGGWREHRHQDARRAELAVRFLRQESQRLEQPWALYVGFTEPVTGFTALKRYYDLYPIYNVDVPHLPPGYLEELHLVYRRLRHYKLLATPVPEERCRRARAGYYGMVSELDEYVGQIWDALRDAGQLENTVFVYTSDHGKSLGEHGLWYLNQLYDEVASVPLVLVGPGLPRNKVVDTPVGHVDLTATLLELAGVELPATLRGRSLLPLVSGRVEAHPGFAYSECHSEGNCTGSFMIRKGEWKYIHFTWYDDLLFNLKEDPGELNNRIDDPQVQDVLEDLRHTLRGLVDPEEVTVRAFQTQERMLQRMAESMTEDELFATFRSRMGPGQARVLAARCKGR